MKSIVRVGLTGGVASGKSHVADWLRKSGITVLDMDAVGRELTEKDPAVLADIQKICGPEAVVNGKLDRAKVREIMFADRTVRKSLEQVIHPRVWEVFEKAADEAAARGEKIILCEAAIIVETGYHEKLDRLVVIAAPEEIRRDRVIARDRLPPGLAQKMIDAQIREEDRLGAATAILYNDGSWEKLRAQVTALMDQWKKENLI